MRGPDRGRRGRAEPRGGALTVTARRARGELRRRAILDATLSLLGRDGASAVTHRSVATEAGVPLAATTYYFDSKDELMRETLAVAAAEDIARLHEQAPGLATSRSVAELADALTALLARRLEHDRATLVAQYEIYLEAARRPTLADISRAWTDAYVDALAPALEALGSPQPERDAWIVVTALDGMGLEALSTGAEPATLQAPVERLLRGLLRVP